jgi:hypothetical protein
MQSPAEILSQLSKAGVLPTMSSSQVSSVLSALAADGCHLDLEAENSHNLELMTQQQVRELKIQDFQARHIICLNFQQTPRAQVLSVSS